LMLDENTSKDLLARYGILRPAHFIIEPHRTLTKKVGPMRLRGQKIRYPVFAKVLGKDLAHKTELGAMRGPVADPRELKEVVLELIEKFPEHDILVEEAVHHKIEFILGIKRDSAFGPVVMFGTGGILTELYQDVAFGRPPIDREMARDMIRSTTIGKVFDGYRGMVIDIGAMVEALVSLSRLALDLGERLDGIDLNPVVIVNGTVVALDAKVVIETKNQEAIPNTAAADKAIIIGYY
jgi:acetate---CoA ligase (ADP-forming)